MIMYPWWDYKYSVLVKADLRNCYNAHDTDKRVMYGQSKCKAKYWRAGIDICVTYHLYADDTQLYMAFKPSDVISKCDAISRIEACVQAYRSGWQNDDKTELLIITTREELSKISDISIKVGDQSISPSDDPPRNLDVIFDSTCCLDAHIAKLCRSINFNLYSVGKIRKYLDGPTAEKMINATVTSRLDYCNNLLYGAKQSHIDRLQCCQNNAARIISKRRKYDHISPVLR